MVSRIAQFMPHPLERETTLRDLQAENMLAVLPLLSLAGLLLVVNEDRFSQPMQVILPGLTLFLVPLVVVALRPRSYRAAAWALVAGSLGGILLAAGWTPLPQVVCLLVFPVGLATSFISPAAGAGTAGVSTVILWLAPPVLLPVDPGLRAATGLAAWTIVALIWLTQRPLVTTMKWSWESYERNRRLLERARDYQVQLKQTLADLADANLQLTRLNQLAQGLRMAAEEARRAKEQFVANVSHELRTPLNMIIGFSEMVVRAPQTYGASIPPALLADLEVILRNSQHLSSLIDDVLDLSQIEAGRVVLSKERVALPEVIEAATTAVRPLYDSKGLYLKIEITPDLPPVLCDRTRIRAVVLNLLSNAGRFTEQGGVRLRTWREGPYVVVSVADSGPGIANEDKERLFRPFEQLDGSIRRRYGGSGLGLAISKSFVELHGGRMWLESEKGNGTTFLFRLPIDPLPPIESNAARWINPAWHYEERTAPSLAPSPKVRPRVVVLDRGDTLQRLLSRSWDGVEIQACVSLDEAIQELARTPSQTLLVNARSMGAAIEQLSQSVALPNGTPMIVCSIPGAIEAASALGVADYMVKPVTAEALLAALERLGLQSGTVLIADDEPDLLRMFDRVLTGSGRGYRVLRAGDGRQALAILREERPDALLLDLAMPEMDGFRLLEIRSQDPTLQQMPVVVISAHDPAGQPIVSSALAVTRAGGLSVPQLLESVQALSRILGPGGPTGGPVPPGKPAG